MPNSAHPFVVLPGEGKKIQGPVGGPVTIKASAKNTAGSFTLIENIVESRHGPPLHTHAGEDEMWYVLEGSFRFKADREIFHAPAGSFVFIPRGTRHCFQNIGREPARILVMFTPSGMEGFFEQHAELFPDSVDKDAYRSMARRYGMEVCGEPLSESDLL